MIDPIEYLEEALATAGADLDRLNAVRAGLARLADDMRTETMIALVAEDDRGERLRLFEEFGVWLELLACAHKLLNEHLIDLALAQRTDR